jgi:hypothetical protein
MVHLAIIYGCYHSDRTIRFVFVAIFDMVDFIGKWRSQIFFPPLSTLERGIKPACGLDRGEVIKVPGRTDL